MYEELKTKRCIDLFKFFEEFDANLTSLSKAELEKLFLYCIESLNIPFPNKELLQYFINIHFIELLLIRVHNKLPLDYRIQKKSQLFERLQAPKSKYFCQYREFGPLGSYPDIEIIRGNCHYSHVQCYPLLLTKNSYATETEFTNYSEVTWLTRNEAKIASCMICSPEYGYFSLDFRGQNTIRIDYNFIKPIPTHLRIRVLSEVLQYLNVFSPIDGGPFSREPKQDITYYNFVNFKESYESFKRLFDSFSIRDHLLLRTSNYFVKASMLWMSQVFGEDAIANTMFCLEGCLLLIQRKHKASPKKINLSLLKSIIENTYPFGKSLFEFIKEGYEKRISIVHPSPRWGAGFYPFLLADDYYEYYDVCKLLLNYVLIDRVLDLT